MRVISKVAMIRGYDDDGRILMENGRYMENSDIASLMFNAMSPGKLIIGEHEFINLLKKASVNPDLILNENIRYKLLNSSSSYMKSGEENRDN